jgi:hypothetical protein
MNMQGRPALAQRLVTTRSGNETSPPLRASIGPTILPLTRST